MSIFVDPASTFDITFVTAKSKSGDDYSDVNEEKLREVNDDLDETTIEKHTCTFRYPNFADNCAIGDASVEVSEGKMKLNPGAGEKFKLTRLLKAWSFKDKDGKPVPVNEQNVSSLDGEVALVIAYLLNEKL